MVIKCGCDGYLGAKAGAEAQDKLYGKGMRAHNPTNKEPRGQHWRCTICGTERTKSGEDSNSKKKAK